VGHRRQWLKLLGFALMTNSLTLAEHQRAGPPLEHAALPQVIDTSDELRFVLLEQAALDPVQALRVRA
jgi:hypothetical protein